jgi:V-type H+-transporting ATPase subunit a
MIIMMGFFAMYAGFVYNDMFSLGLNLFGSRYEFEGQDTRSVEEGAAAYQLSQFGSDDSVYPFGLDPIWKVASNELLFFNSFKMKLSVIFGIFQMFAGTCLKGLNAIYFGEKLDFLFEFLPMVAFASSLFVYMIVLIFMKWSINWNSRMLSATCLDPAGDTWGTADYLGEWVICDQSGDGTCTPWGFSCSGNDNTVDKCPLDYGGSGDGCQPPNLITTLINIALQPGNVDEPIYSGQAGVQNSLLCIAFLAVPILLLAKPYFLSRQHAAHAAIEHGSHGDGDEESGDHDEDGGSDGHGFGEILIHQAIETIEFVLGMVSNTASYLRLWALSLAHSQLATVFWQKAMLSTLNVNWFAAYLGFGIFGGVTFGVLLMMDVLECFLHALRLHWVEFQNKFFKADGVRFMPYSFKQVIKDSQA